MMWSFPTASRAYLFLAAIVASNNVASSKPLFGSSLRGLGEDDLQLEVFPFPDNSNSIINGEVAGAGDFPWYARFDGDILCGGTLVHEDIVVTAAHCIEGNVPPQVSIGPSTTANGQTRDVCGSVSHPNFRSKELENDIAILVLCDSANAQPALINTDDASPADAASLTAMGFGRTDPNTGGGSSVLQRIDLNYLNGAECSAVFSAHNDDYNMCVDNPNGGICFGDSGGPIVDAGGVVYGVASFIIQECNSKFPDFYTRMSSYSTWVQNRICDEAANPPDNCDSLGDDDGPDGGNGGATDCPFIDFFTELCDTLFGGIFG